MRLRTSFDSIWQLVKRSNCFVPPQHNTIGGMWSVDTWTMGDVTIQLMDEGWTRRIITPSFIAVQSGNREVEMTNGTPEDVVLLAAILYGETTPVEKW